MSAALGLCFGAPLPVSQWEVVSWATFTNLALDASGDRTGWVFQASTADQITAVGFRHAAITGTSPTYKVSIQGVATANKYPDGTIKGGGSPASATFTPSGGGGYGSGTWHWITLDNAYTPTRGEMLSVVIAYDSGTIDASNTSSFTQGIRDFSSASSARTFPYPVQDTTGSWSASAGQAFSVFGLKSGSTVLRVEGAVPIETGATLVAMAGTVEAGMSFTLPSGWTDTYKVSGAHAKMRGLTTGSLWCMTLYSDPTGTPTALQQVTFDSDQTHSFNNVATMLAALFDETTLSTLSAGTKYGIGFVGINVATDLAIYYLGVDSVGDWDGFDFGQQCSWMQRTLSTGFTGAGTEPNESTAFTETTTQRPTIEVILDDLTKPAGGGGGGSQRTIGG